MPRLIRGSLVALLLGVFAIAATPSGGLAAKPTDESPFGFGVKFERPEVSLERVLRREQLVVRYSCMRACGPSMKLKVAGIGISTFDPPGGPTAGIRAAVFELDPPARHTIATHTHRGGATFRLEATFTNRAADRLVRTLRFRLRR